MNYPVLPLEVTRGNPPTLVLDPNVGVSLWGFMGRSSPFWGFGLAVAAAAAAAAAFPRHSRGAPSAQARRPQRGRGASSPLD